MAELAQRATLVEVEARLAQTASFNETELRSQALVRAANDRRQGWLFLKGGPNLMKHPHSL